MGTQKMFCEVKLHHKRDFKAKHKCRNCNKHLCAGCAILHRNNRQSRDHFIEDIKPEGYHTALRNNADASPRLGLDTSPGVSFDASPRVSFDVSPRVTFYNGYENSRTFYDRTNRNCKKRADETATMNDFENGGGTLLHGAHSKTNEYTKPNEALHTHNHIRYTKHFENDAKYINQVQEPARDNEDVLEPDHPKREEKKGNVKESITDLDIDQMNEKTLRMCPQHDDKEVEYFCGDHNALACGRCAVFEHRKCEKLTTIESKMKQFENDDFLPKLTKQIDTISNHLSDLSSKDDKCIRALTASHAGIPKDFGKLKFRIMKMLEKVEQKLTDNADVMFHGMKTELENHKAQCSTLQECVSQSQKSLTKVSKPTNGLNKFVVCCKVEKELERYEKLLFEVHKEATAPKLTFKVGVDVDQMMHDFTTSLEIGVRQPKPKIPAFPVSKHLAERKAVFVKRFCAKTMSDESCPRLCGSTFLPFDKIALVDQANKKLKIFHKNYVLLAEKEFDSPPWNVVLVNETCVAVSLYEQKEVQVLRFGGFTLAVVRTIKSRSEPYALTMLPEMGILSTFDVNEDKASIGLVTNEDSKRYLKKFPAKTTRNVAFKGSLGLTYNDVKSTYYVSSYTSDRVTGISTTGSVAFMYEHIDLVRPFGISLDGDGNIYVCSTSNSKIHQLLPNGNLNKYMLTEADGIIEPLDISFNDDGDVFLVTCEKCDIVRIYKLE